MEVAGSERRVEADFGDSNGRCLWHRRRCMMVAGTRKARGGYHVFAFEAATIDARRKCADAVPRRVEGVIAAFQLGVAGCLWFRGTAAADAVKGGTSSKVQRPSWFFLKVRPGDAELAMESSRVWFIRRGSGRVGHLRTFE